MVGVSVERIEQVLACVVVGRERQTLAVAGMTVCFDQTRDDRLALQVDPPGAVRDGKLARPADAGELVAFHDKRARFDRRSTIAEDQAGAFEHDRTAEGLTRLSPEKGGPGGNDEESWDRLYDAHITIRLEPRGPSRVYGAK